MVHDWQTIKRFFYMDKISNIIRKNKIYTVLFVFVLFINLLIFAGWIMEKYSSEPAESVQSEAGVTFDRESMEVKRERIESLAYENPFLYFFLAIFNLAILFFVFIGVIFDAYFIRRWLQKRPLDIRIISQDNPRWDIADIVRVTLIFMSCGYLFLILQGFFVRFLPVLYNENFRMIFNTVVMNIVGVSVILYFIVKKYKQDVQIIGLTSKKVLNSIFYAAVGYIALVPVLLGVMTATLYITEFLRYHPPAQSIVQVFIEEKNTPLLLFSALFAAIFGPVAEEIFFRGFMYPAIKKRIGIFGAMIITSVIFSFLHAHIVGFLPIMILGLLLAYLYEKTGSLITSISVHIMHNVGMVIMVFVIKYLGS